MINVGDFVKLNRLEALPYKNEKEVIRKVISRKTFEGKVFIGADGGPRCEHCKKPEGTRVPLMIEALFEKVEA